MRTGDAKKCLQRPKPVSFNYGLSTGSTLLNLACSGRIDYGFLPGTYVFFVGDSTSGKTFLSMTCVAEASISPKFDRYRFIFDNAENGALMDIRKFFGERVERRLEPPAGARVKPVYSETVEDLFRHLNEAFDHGKPFVYVLDSQDSLTCRAALKKNRQTRAVITDGKEEAAGTFGTDKAKLFSTGLPEVIAKLRKTGSILVVISQTRDRIGFGSQFDPKTRSGGRALTFYATLELWSSVRARLKKKVAGKDRFIGMTSRVRVKKNRVSGRDRSVDIPIYHSVGIDDLGGCVDYLVEEGRWSQAKDDGPVTAADWDVQLKREKLVQHVEENGLEGELRLLVAETWNDIESKCEVKRKNRYAGG
jgi:RecA/RadA recombinase